MWLSVLVAVLASLVQATPHKPPSPSCINVDVAVIGGGSSGIHAAIGLKDAGASVVVIEKKSQIGGHAETYINPTTKIPTNVGVIIFENRDVVSKYFARLKVPTKIINPLAGAASQQSKSYDFTLGIPIPAQTPAEGAASQQVIASAMVAYSQNVLPKYPWIDAGYLVPDPVPPELLVPFGQFAEQNKFVPLLTLIAQMNWYTGNITTIPALYGIKKLGPGLLKSLTSGFIVPQSGNSRSLYDAAAAELGDSVLLDSTVVDIKRRKSGISIVVKQRNKPVQKIKARKLVIAVPQVLDNIGRFDLSLTERALLSKFSAYGYFVGVVDIPGLNVTLNNVGAFTPAHTPVIPGSSSYRFTGSPNEFILSLGFDNTKYTVASAKALVRKELQTLAKIGGVPADAPMKATFPYVSNHAPFELHVSAKDIQQGFYKQFNGLQGSRDTFWTGAAFTGHNSGLIWQFNEDTLLPAMKESLCL